MRLVHMTSGTSWPFQLPTQCPLPHVPTRHPVILSCQHNQAKSLDMFKVMESKSSIRHSNRAWQKHMADETHERLSPQLSRHIVLVKNKGALSWMSVLPLVDHGLSLNTGMQSVSDMAGLCPILHLNTVVARISWQIML